VNINQNTLLYFISTVPQVLAALLALLGVFYVLHLEKYKNWINEKIENAQNIYLNRLHNIRRSEYNKGDYFAKKKKVLNSLFESKFIFYDAKKYADRFIVIHEEEEGSVQKSYYDTINNICVSISYLVTIVHSIKSSIKRVFILFLLVYYFLSYHYTP